ncbi:hypothetical protein V2J09_022394 [Rumex salicifolius]
MSAPEFPLEVERIRYPEIDLSSEVGWIKGEEEPPKASIVDDHMFVAVGKKVRENKSTVIWALQNSRGKKICILHVHTTSQMIPIFGAKFPVNQLGEKEVISYHELERNKMHKSLDDYVQLCSKAGVNASKLSMTQLKSKKAIYVQSQAPPFCQILFVCKGYLIYTREGVMPQYPNNKSGEIYSNSMRSQRKTELSDNKSDIFHDTDESSTPRMSFGSSPVSARPSTSSVKGSSPLSHQSDMPQTRSLLPLNQEYETSMGDQLYDRLDKLMQEADSLREEAYLESMKRQKAEKEAIEAALKVQAIESLYYQEQNQRREADEKLANEKKELEATKNLHAEVLEELEGVLVKKSCLEKEIEKSNLIVEQLDNKLSAAVGLLKKYKKERDDMDTYLDDALLQNELLRRQLACFEPQVSRFFADFTHLEILHATDNFNLSWKIGEGGFGDTYKGILRHTQVAIKLLSLDNMQGPQEFQQEVDTLSKLRHPNIVTLIGVCSEASALIYEYLPNGNLDERLACKDNTPPLSWQTRIRVAAELCSALMFSHSCRPKSIVIGDLKPANILLDAHLSCKLCDFGICRAVYKGESTTRLYKTDPKGTFAYMDPEYLSSGELTPKSDVYSFGIVLLRLMTGKSALGIVKEVQSAVDKDDLEAVLDYSSGGEWPFLQAKQLVLLGLRCCEMQRKNRPDLEADVWRVLQLMWVSSSSSYLGQDEQHDHVPSYFMCPIFQEVMQDPQIAADGFTYEAEALKGWLDSGHDTSPMTNLKLENHVLIPNRALRSAIQEWLRHPPST